MVCWFGCWFRGFLIGFKRRCMDIYVNSGAGIHASVHRCSCSKFSCSISSMACCCCCRSSLELGIDEDLDDRCKNGCRYDSFVDWLG
jgi:hypothetical protein